MRLGVCGLCNNGGTRAEDVGMKRMKFLDVVISVCVVVWVVGSAVLFYKLILAYFVAYDPTILFQLWVVFSVCLFALSIATEEAEPNIFTEPMEQCTKHPGQVFRRGLKCPVCFAEGFRND